MKYAVTILLLLLAVTGGRAQTVDPAPEGAIVREISFDPPDNTSSLYDLIELSVGEAYSASALRSSLKNLFRLDIYSDIRVSWQAVDGGISLLFHLEELPIIEGVTIRGIAPLSRQHVITALGFDREQRFSQALEQRIVSELRSLYRQRGYYSAMINLYSMVNLETGGIRLELGVEPGEPTRLRQIRIYGYPAIDESLILAAFTRTPIDGVFREDVFRDELRDVLAFYHKEKYLTADVSLTTLEYDEAENRIDAVLTINAGPKIETTFTEPEKDADLWITMIPFSDKNVPLDEIFSKGQENITRALREIGYVFAETTITFEYNADAEAIQAQIQINRGDAYRVKNIIIEGLDDDLRQQVMAQMQLAKKGWFSTPTFSEETLMNDVENSINLLKDLGYRDANASLTEFDENHQETDVDMVLLYDPGNQYRISSIGFIGNSFFEVSELLELIDLKVGDPVLADSVERAVESLRRFYDALGFADVSIAARMSGETSDVELVFDISEGEPSSIKKIIVAGNRLTDESVIRRALTFTEGEPYSRDKVAESHRSLYRLGIFDRIEISTVDEDFAGSEKRVVIRVDETRPYSLLYGFGVDSEEKFRFSFGFSNSNIAGRNIEAAFSTRISQLQQRYQISIRAPKFLQGRLDNTLRLFYEELARPGYGARKKGLLLETSGFSWRDWSIVGRMQYKWIDLFDVQEGIVVNRYEESVRLSLLSTVVTRDSRNDLTDPTQGSLTNAIIQFAPRFLGGDSGFVKTEGHYFFYRSIFPSIVFAGGMRIGVAWAFDNDEIPISERFFLGGSTTLRGFPLDGVGPTYEAVTSEYLPAGGNAMVNGNLELRFPLVKGIGGVTFYDFGNVYDKVENIEFDTLEHSVGLGIRLGTPLGPLRVDYGKSLKSDDKEFYFTFGHAF